MSRNILSVCGRFGSVNNILKEPADHWISRFILLRKKLEFRDILQDIVGHCILKWLIQMKV